ncbi:MAG: GAF domain-containing protein, partial [Bacteroidia bacterium]|nr:GAF domain-containing protein [Bacteroidia bacterium]
MEKLEIPKGSKSQVYDSLIPQIHALIDGENDLYAN